MNCVVETENLTKHYGSVRALTNLNLKVEAGSIFGILGPNGSGKTTCLGILLDVVKPDRGSYKWFEKEPSHITRRKKIGALLETPNFYSYLSASANLKITARIKNRSEKKIQAALQLTGLTERRNSPYRTFSLGMKQRLAIAAALLNSPEVLVLDEPTNGLDPQGIAEIRTLIQEIGKQGKTILLASHMLDEVEKVCTHVAILKAGELMASGKVSELSGKDNLVEVAAENMDAFERIAKELSGLKQVRREKDKLILSFTNPVSAGEVNRYFFEKGVILTALNQRRSTLESLFLEITSRNV